MTDQAPEDRRPDLTQAVLREVGPRLRAARLKRDLTLEALSDTTGISPSTLSRLESGKRAPNLELLIPVTRALRLSLDDLLMWTAPDPRIRSRTQRFGNHTVEYLSPESAPVQTFKMTLTPTNEPIQTRSHDGYEWCYVLRGRARVILGDRELVIVAGQLRSSTLASRTGSPPSAASLSRSWPFSTAAGNASTCQSWGSPTSRGSVERAPPLYVLEPINPVRRRKCNRGD